MAQDFGSNILALEEWNVRAIRRIESRYDTLSLSNKTGTEIEESALADLLAQVAGRERIKSLRIRASSKVKNLLFLKALPSLETILVNGLQLQSLDGLEWFHGRFIEIDTDRNRKRTIDKIAETPITRLSLHWAHPGDLEAIGRSTTIRELDLSNCPKLALDRWQNVPLEALCLWSGAIDQLADSAQIGVQQLTLFGCRHFERFEGDNSTITWGVIQNCNRLDWQTIRTLRRLASLNVTGSKIDLPLSAFAGLGELRNLSLRECKVQLDVLDLKSTATQLEKLYMTGLKNEQVVELSRANSGVLVSNGRWSYKDGAPVQQ
jgi:hypothetical protein